MKLQMLQEQQQAASPSDQEQPDVASSYPSHPASTYQSHLGSVRDLPWDLIKEAAESSTHEVSSECNEIIGRCRKLVEALGGADVVRVLTELEELETALKDERHRNDELEAAEKQREARFLAQLEKQREAHKADVDALEAIIHKLVHQNELLSCKLSSFAAMNLMEKPAHLGIANKEASSGSMSDSSLSDSVSPLKVKLAAGKGTMAEPEGSTSEGSVSDEIYERKQSATSGSAQSSLDSDASLTCSATHSDDNASETESRSNAHTSKDGSSADGTSSPQTVDSPYIPSTIADWKQFQ